MWQIEFRFNTRIRLFDVRGSLDKAMDIAMHAKHNNKDLRGYVIRKV